MSQSEVSHFTDVANAVGITTPKAGAEVDPLDAYFIGTIKFPGDPDAILVPLYTDEELDEFEQNLIRSIEPDQDCIESLNRAS